MGAHFMCTSKVHYAWEAEIRFSLSSEHINGEMISIKDLVTELYSTTPSLIPISFRGVSEFDTGNIGIKERDLRG
jgi:hypothetical protein